MSPAASAVPRTSAGMIMRVTFAKGSSKSGTKPEAGSQPSRTETNRISMIPSQKFGIDTPHSETALARTSQAVLRRTAAITPAGIANDNAIRSARHASSTVIGTLIATVHATDCRVRIDSPRSPRRARPTHRRYWTGIGSCRPYFSRISSSPAASASVPAMTRAGSPGIIRTPVKTMRLMRTSVTAEMTVRRTRNSITRLLPARPLDADQTVRDGLVALQVLRERDDVILEVEIDDVPAGEDVIHRLAVEGGALGDVADLARLVQECVRLLVAREGVVEAPATGVELVHVVVGVDAPAPGDEEGLEFAVLVVRQRGGELLGRQRDGESGFARHALDDLADASLLRIVDDHQLEREASREPGVGEQLLGTGHVARRAFPALVEERADRRDRGTPRRVQAVPRHLVERLAVDRELERLANARVVGERRPEVPGRLRLATLVAEVDGDAVVPEARHVRDLEPTLLLEARRVRRRDQVHDVDVAGAQVGQADVVVGDDPEHDAVESRGGGVEVAGRALDDDPILGQALDELPRTDAHGGGAELVAELLN